ncbi:MAG: VOC family protein [Planctomycetes bacterium]|nr:VOC family protein [Planctomycetota bacterium]
MATRKTQRRAARRPAALAFHHAMLYTRDLERALGFYRDRLGFRVVDEYPGAYARLAAPKGNGTIAIHVLEPGQWLDPKRGGMRLYFEVQPLAAFCKRLARDGVVFDQPPQRMPWGWQHAYLRDPDGHELSLFFAGPARLRPTRKPRKSER